MNVQVHAKGYRRAGRWGKAFFGLFAIIEIPDRPKIMDQGAVIVAANHRSFFDLFLAYILMVGWGVTPRMMVRGSYFELPILGWILKATGCIPVDKGGGKDAIDQALIELNANRPVAIMPEGRLVKSADRPTGVGSARDGIGILAVKSGAPVVVVGVTGSERVWPMGKPVPLPRLKRTKLVSRYRVLTELSGSATEVKDVIMENMGGAVRDAEAFAIGQ
ncbi:MAG: lysophospholipid acyltransferase family protein [Acidimicrobiales bacterium]